MLCDVTYGLSTSMKVGSMVVEKDRFDVVFTMPDADVFRLSPQNLFPFKDKYFLDACVILLLSVPIILIMSVVAIGIVCDSPGPILFCQKRLGKNGKTFTILKFRTMYDTTCTMLRHAQAAGDDPRITRFGRWLRRTSLDELPQLLNVLRGEMSLVGPRPHAIAHDAFFSSRVQDYWGRYAIRPGLSGLAQVSGYRGETPLISDMQQRIDHDLRYIQDRTLIMDIRILLKTVAIMVHPQPILS